MYQGFASYKNWDFDHVNYTNAEYGMYLLVHPCPLMTFSLLKVFSSQVKLLTYVGVGLRWTASCSSSNHW